MQTRWSVNLCDRTRISYSYTTDAQKMEPGKHLHVAVVGVGGVGTQVVQQMIANPIYGFQLVALTSSKRMLTCTKDVCINPVTWKDALKASETPVDLPALKNTLQELVKQGEKALFIDNTSSQDVAEMYPELLSAGINVITPNKKAFSGDVGLYKGIVEASRSGRYLHESTVGAGLPIISTLRDLVETGDKVVKIEGVFSGTMSYIFNNFSSVEGSDESFSSIVKGARAQGYTEPNPADDLNGADVARKLTILARIIPEMKDEQGNFPLLHWVPVCGDHFLDPGRPCERYFQRGRASKEGSVLRYVGVVDVKNKIVKAELAKCFATSLGGSDNIIMFHTERYGKRPLIVQGAGAGNDVTAIGVMSDVLKLIRP
ncbi:homoserine dehydrogenase-domain-containing protein [Suillus paluster]|uniref:homoserine dehydrogenase-domain-containing protein n=1 Tax=Suillus paluster TaxID=48578 RepID=UPI001B867727|nr:homoserine dehydrogenase-domain-containing protein [Suillus paluster]KAG1748318.1 homoserine dehydrogenase-domain-containing protein [Suillus paluster]